MVAVKYLRQRGLKYREVSEITGFAEQNLRLLRQAQDRSGTRDMMGSSSGRRKNTLGVPGVIIFR